MNRKLTLLVALASVLAIATGVVYSSDPASEPRDQTSRGQVLFMGKGCGGCHTIIGVSEGGIGPDLTFVGDVAGDRVKGLTAGIT
jgi:mono/diheme cytochrome c family protein